MREEIVKLSKCSSLSKFSGTIHTLTSQNVKLSNLPNIKDNKPNGTIR